MIERLLEQQRQYQDWLDKLDEEAKGAAPSHVTDRVRSDYAARLEEVTAELREHGDALRQALAEAKQRAEGLQKQHAERTDELSEARLRRQVGEYDEDRYEEVAVRCKAALGELTKAIATADRDIERYEEILQQIEGEAEEAEAEEEEVIEELAPLEEEPAPVKARGAPPEPEVHAPKPRIAPVDVDELAFLRSITGEEKETGEPAAPKEPPPRRVSQPAVPIPAAAAEPAPPPPPPAKPVAEAPPPPPPPPPPEPKPAEAPKAKRAAEGARAPEEGGSETRTLVCSECGTKNLPTEWYCEKCGAELSAF